MNVFISGNRAFQIIDQWGGEFSNYRKGTIFIIEKREDFHPLNSLTLFYKGYPKNI